MGMFFLYAFAHVS